MSNPLANTLVAQQWGPELWQRFNYWAHPIRDTGGNPCLIWRHGGGGWAGNYSGGEFGIEWPLLWYLLQAERAVHFDVISIQTCQQFIDDQAIVPRTTRHNMWDNIVDHQRGVCAIKAWGTGALTGQTAYRLNPKLIFTGGDSFGATVTGLSMIRPPITFPTSWALGARGAFDAGQYDSTTKGVVYHRGQVDFRQRLLANGSGAPVLRNYLNPTEIVGIFGTRAANAGTEWDSHVPTSFKEAVSLIAYLESPETRIYARPMFTVYGDEPLSTFAGTYPLANNHDKKMREDLNAALLAAGVPFETGLSEQGVGDTDYEISPAMQVAIYNWLARLASGESR